MASGQDIYEKMCKCPDACPFHRTSTNSLLHRIEDVSATTFHSQRTRELLDDLYAYLTASSL